jgi:hypothetical protein
MAGSREIQTAVFLRMVAIELRKLAELEAAIAHTLNGIADQLDAEATDIEARNGRGFS